VIGLGVQQGFGAAGKGHNKRVLRNQPRCDCKLQLFCEIDFCIWPETIRPRFPV
jgi:hypothetical protein